MKQKKSSEIKSKHLKSQKAMKTLKKSEKEQSLRKKQHRTKTQKNSLSQNNVTGRRDKVNFCPFGARFQSPITNTELKTVVAFSSNLYWLLARHEWPRWGYSGGLYTAQTRTILAFRTY